MYIEKHLDNNIMCQHIYETGHPKAGTQCASRQKSEYCSAHVKLHASPKPVVEVVKPVVVEVVEEPVVEASDVSTVDSSEDEAEPVVEDLKISYVKQHNLLSTSEYVDAWRALGKDIDHQCLKKTKVDHDLLSTGYYSVLRFEFCSVDDNNKGTVISGRMFYFKSDTDKESFKDLRSKINDTQYCLSNELYDHRLYNLCCIMKRTWFSDTNNLWNLAGMLYQKQHTDLRMMCKTYLCILHSMTDRFDLNAALKVFNDWEDSKYHPKINESQLKSIAGGSNAEAYRKWKDEYEPKEVKCKKSSKNKDDDVEIKYPKFARFYENGQLPPIFDCKVEESYLDVIALKKNVISMERLFDFVKDNIAYILDGGNGYYLTKNRDSCGTIDYKVVHKLSQFDMAFKINNSVELDDDGMIETDNTETESDVVNVQLSEVIAHYRDDITYGKIDFVPYNGKTGACDRFGNSFDWNSNRVFNKFNGFVHRYDPDFVVDSSKFKSFSSHIKDIWCNGRDDLNDYTMKMFAWYVQRPYEKSTACLVLEGEEGAGKNIVSNILSQHIIGKQYCLETPKISNLTGRFNAARENKILTALNEAASVSKSSHADQEELKDVITEDSCMIERKGIDPYRVKDCNNVIIISNNSFSVKASTQMRRYVCYLLSSDRIGDDAYFKSILNEFNKADGGIHLYHHLMSIDLTNFHPQNDAPMTQTKMDMQKMAIDKPIKWMVECIKQETDNNLFCFNDYEEDQSGFKCIDDMLADFTQWLINTRDGSSYTKDRFSKSLAKFLGPNSQKSVNKIRKRGYDLSVSQLKEKITKHTRRNDLFED